MFKPRERAFKQFKCPCPQCVNDKGTCLLMDTTISGDRNVINEKAKKILKYKGLTVETQYMWNVQVEIKVIQVITGTI